MTGIAGAGALERHDGYHDIRTLRLPGFIDVNLVLFDQPPAPRPPGPIGSRRSRRQGRGSG